MKDKAKLVEYILQFIKNGEFKVIAQNGKAVKLCYRINDKENILTEQDIADLERLSG
jgi:hypothetical protein